MTRLLSGTSHRHAILGTRVRLEYRSRRGRRGKHFRVGTSGFPAADAYDVGNDTFSRSARRGAPEDAAQRRFRLVARGERKRSRGPGPRRGVREAEFEDCRTLWYREHVTWPALRGNGEASPRYSRSRQARSGTSYRHALSARPLPPPVALLCTFSRQRWCARIRTHRLGTAVSSARTFIELLRAARNARSSAAEGMGLNTSPNKPTAGCPCLLVRAGAGASPRLAPRATDALRGLDWAYTPIAKAGFARSPCRLTLDRGTEAAQRVTNARTPRASRG